MNTANIAALVEQLDAIGIKHASSPLIKRICLQPGRFSLDRTIIKGSDTLHLHFLFDKAATDGSYSLVQYDAVLQKEVPQPVGIINEVDIAQLDADMQTIDWKDAFAVDDDRPVLLSNETSWAQERLIESVMARCSQLSSDPAGKPIAIALKQKHWEGTAYAEVLEPITTTRSKSEISQRFYVQADSIISIDEAYRFLQNKWLEKQLQQKEKTTPAPHEGESNNMAVPAHGVLKKFKRTKRTNNRTK